MQFEIFIAGATLGDLQLSNHKVIIHSTLAKKMNNLQFLILDCLVVLMMIGPQSVSAQALGAVYFRGSGSMNPQAISPTRALSIGSAIVKASIDVGGAFGIGFGVLALVVLCWMYYIYEKYYKNPQPDPVATA